MEDEWGGLHDELVEHESGRCLDAANAHLLLRRERFILGRIHPSCRAWSGQRCVLPIRRRRNAQPRLRRSVYTDASAKPPTNFRKAVEQGASMIGRPGSAKGAETAGWGISDDGQKKLR